MNLDDLRAELDAHANDLDTHATGRMAGIRAKVAQRQRRKAGATVAASVLAVGAIVAVPAVNQLSAGPEPAKQAPFPEKIDGDTMIASTMGDKGDTKVTLEFTPEDTDFLLDVDCEGLGQEVARARVNGRWTSAICGNAASGVSSGEVGGVASRAKVRRLWERMGVRAGESVTITVRATDLALKPTQSTEGTLGVAAYAMTGERRNVVGVALPEEKTVDGEVYTLGDDGFAVGPTRPKGTQRVYVPASDEQSLVTYGSPDRGSITRVTIDGAQETTGGVSSELMSSGGARTVRLRNLSDKKWARLVVAYYTPVEEDEDTDPPDLSFPDVTDERDPLIASDVGESGETAFRTTFTPDDGNLALAYGCATSKSSRDDVVTSLYIEGKKVEWGGECYGYDGLMWLADDAAANRRLWLRKHGISAGESFDVEVRARRVDGKDVSLDEVVLGAALYQRSAPRTRAGAFVLADCQRRGGIWYILADYATVKVTDDDRRAELSVPGTDSGHALMWVGRKGKGESGMFDSVVDGRVRAHHTGTISTLERVSGDPHELAVRANRQVRGGQLVIAYYVPEE